VILKEVNRLSHGTAEIQNGTGPVDFGASNPAVTATESGILFKQLSGRKGARTGWTQRVFILLNTRHAYRAEKGDRFAFRFSAADWAARRQEKVQ
jgi:hypothetical protein